MGSACSSTKEGTYQPLPAEKGATPAAEAPKASGGQDDTAAACPFTGKKQGSCPASGGTTTAAGGASQTTTQTADDSHASSASTDITHTHTHTQCTGYALSEGGEWLGIAKGCHFPGQLAKPIVTKEVAQICDSSWKAMMACESKYLREMKAKDKNYSAVSGFYDAFYAHLFEIAPHVRTFFSSGGIQKRATSLSRMVSTGLTYISKSPKQMESTLSLIAEGHAKLGIHAEHYAPVVLAFFYAFEKLLGADDQFTLPVKTAWVTVYSLICNIMVPVAKKHELELKKKSKSSDDSSKKSKPETSTQGSKVEATTTTEVKAPLDRKETLSEGDQSESPVIRAAKVYANRTGDTNASFES